jgi:starch synthase
VNGIPLYLLEQPELFVYPDVYPNTMDPEAVLPFIFLSLAALELPGAASFSPGILHLHDWTAAAVSAALRWHRHYQTFADRYDTVFTIHNLAHQGIVSQAALNGWGFHKASFSLEGFEFYGHVNLLKGGVVTADAVTTVSPSYSWEIQFPDGGMGLQGVLAEQRSKLSGILNGIDRDIWDPRTDPIIPARYTPEDLSGKAVCRRALCERIGFPQDDRPLTLFVGRLVEQKGIDLILAAMEGLLKSSRILVVGTGNALYADRVRDLAARLPDQVHAFTDFDEEFAHLAYAGADLLLMPSLFEPCGISQLIAMAYGTIPVVRAVGGLADTVIDVDASGGELSDGTGFLFADYTASELLLALRRALLTRENIPRWTELQRRAMGQDFSWKNSAGTYLRLYLDLLGVELPSRSPGA